MTKDSSTAHILMRIPLFCLEYKNIYFDTESRSKQNWKILKFPDKNNGNNRQVIHETQILEYVYYFFFLVPRNPKKYWWKNNWAFQFSCLNDCKKVWNGTEINPVHKFQKKANLTLPGWKNSDKYLRERSMSE